MVNYPEIDYQDQFYYAAPKRRRAEALDEVDPESWRPTPSWASR
jgi:Fe-S cluster assembly protein SufB